MTNILGERLTMPKQNPYDHFRTHYRQPFNHVGGGIMAIYHSSRLVHDATEWNIDYMPKNRFVIEATNRTIGGSTWDDEGHFQF